MIDRGNGARAPKAISVRVRREALLRKALLGTTALIGITLAGTPAHAQTCTFLPVEGTPTPDPCSGGGGGGSPGATPAPTPAPTPPPTPSTFNVNDEASLAAAITSANGNPGSTIIVGANITIFNLLPVVTAATTIQSAAGNTFTISGNNQYRLFFVDAGAGAVNFTGLVLSGGRAQGGTGGTGAGGGGGGMGAGGAIFVNSGNVTATDVSFTGNAAAGGTGGTATGSGSGGGGGGLGGSGGSAGSGGGGGGGYSGGGGGGGAGTYNGAPNGYAAGAGGTGAGGAGGSGAAAGSGGNGTNGAAGGTGSSSSGGGNTFTYGGGGGGGGSNAGVGGVNAGGGGGGGGYTGTGGAGGDNTRASAALDATGVGAGGGGSSGNQNAGDGTDFGGGGGAFYGQTAYDSVNSVIVTSVQGVGGQGGYGGGGGGGGSFPGGVGNTVADAGGQGGFGGGGGGDPHTADSSSGGVGGGRGNRGGGGGMGAGGAVFVRSGSFSIAGSTNFTGGTVTAGAGTSGAGAGAAAGSAMFLASGTTTGFAVTGTKVVSDTIADDSVTSLAGGTYTAGNGAGAAVSVTGGGTLVLTGANTYAGGTTVTGSTLQLGNGGTTGSVAGAVTLASNGVFQVNRTGTISNAVSGVGTVRVSSNATLSGALSANGGVDIDAATTVTLGNVSADTSASAAVRMGAGATVNTSGSATLTGRWGVYNTLGAATVNNAGTITAAIDGISQQPGSGDLTVTNTGAIQTSQGAGSAAGIYINAAGTHAINNNNGVIIGGTNATFGYGISIDAGSATITNNSGGRIGGPGATGAIRLSSTGAQILNLNAGSTVTGNIFVEDSGAVTTALAGTLNGSYNAGTATGAQSFTLAATGSMQGATFGSANDTFTYQGGTISGAINAGAGSNDVFTSALGTSGTGSLNLSLLTGFESYTHQSGALTLTGSRTTGYEWLLTGGSVAVSGTLGASLSAQALELRNGASASILAGGVIGGSQNGILVNGVTATTVTNAGTINSPGAGIQSSNAAMAITNTGTIAPVFYSAIVFAYGGSLNNSGTITGGNDVTNVIAAVRSAGASAVAITNTGSITAQAGQGISLAGGGTIANGDATHTSALIRASAGSGIHNDGAIGLTATNYGRIDGTAAGAGQAASSGNFTLNNLGTASIVYGAGSYGAFNTGTGRLTVTNAGLVASNGSNAIYGSGAVTLTNTGTVATGTVDAGGVLTVGGTGNAVRILGAATIDNGGLISGQPAAWWRTARST